MQQYQQFINGQFVHAINGNTRNVINPATEEVFATVPDSGAADVDAAVRAARTAFDSGAWSNMYALDRGKYLIKVAGLIRNHREELVTVEVNNNGKPKHQSKFACK